MAVIVLSFQTSTSTGYSGAFFVIHTALLWKLDSFDVSEDFYFFQSFGLHYATNIPRLKIQLYSCDWPVHFHSDITFEGDGWDATLIKFKWNGLAGVWKINTALITPTQGSRETCCLVVALERGEKERGQGRPLAVNLSLGISSGMLEELRVTPKNSQCPKNNLTIFTLYYNITPKTYVTGWTLVFWQNIDTGFFL